MQWATRYIPPDPTLWQGRQDLPSAACFFQAITSLNLLLEHPPQAETIRFALVGFKCDEGIRRDLGRIGAAEGPTAIRQSLGKLPIQKSPLTCYDVGNIVCLDHDLEASQYALGEVIALLLENRITPIVLGGGHELAWGHFQGIAKTYPHQHLGIINFDAHFDMEPMHPRHQAGASTPFTQIAEAHRAARRHFDYNCIGIQHAGNIRQLFDTAKHYHTHIILADELHQGQQEKCLDFVDRVIDQNEIIYLSLALDVFATPYAPGVSSVQPLGLNPWHVIPLIRQIAGSGKVIGYDIAELCPRYDIHHCTAKLAALMIYEIIHHHVCHIRY
ncbi:MAG: formimidoylglutamase [Gammaproteobacteria bacterium RIFCSPHIGHO2_12_FULL_41_20]|nr:MAG: formimidoylglutamase [Gammaproteobacteria bacterium RIFCSPHIGHO2_12_FULL_41_20]